MDFSSDKNIYDSNGYTFLLLLQNLWPLGVQRYDEFFAFLYLEAFASECISNKKFFFIFLCVKEWEEKMRREKCGLIGLVVTYFA